MVPGANITVSVIVTVIVIVIVTVIIVVIGTIVIIGIAVATEEPSHGKMCAMRVPDPSIILHYPKYDDKVSFQGLLKFAPA